MLMVLVVLVVCAVVVALYDFGRVVVSPNILHWRRVLIFFCHDGKQVSCESYEIPKTYFLMICYGCYD